MIDTTLDHLALLLSHDTSDPARTLHADHPMFAQIRDLLVAAGCEVTTADLGGGCVNLLGVRGEPEILLNAHLDTVPAGDDWTTDPFEMTVRDGLVLARGACDTKGGAAAMIAAIERTDKPVAVLFTTDEEAGQGQCVNTFIESASFAPRVVVVAEPTAARAVLAHRGFVSFEVAFSGTAGHTSSVSDRSASAIHAAIGWANGELHRFARPDLADERFNIGIVQGGHATNVVAPSCLLRCGFRPSMDAGPLVRGLLDGIARSARSAGATVRERMVAPPLPPSPAAERFAESWSLPRGPDVDFWTEASLFAAAGWPAIVLGPGDIAQAHATDEFVTIEQLGLATERYTAIIENGAGDAA